MRIVVTGCSGYVGPFVTRALRSSTSRAELIGIDAGFFAAQHEGEGPSPMVDMDEVHFVDVRDVKSHHFRGVTSVIHLAALSNDPMGDRYAELTHEVNQVQTIRIAEIARNEGVRFFTFASSASVYGAGSSVPRTESSELAPQTAYARSKVDSELGLQQLANRDFLVTCLRFATACGWSPRIRLDLVLNDFVAAAITTGVITVLSDGTPWRPLIHVRDMARAIEWSVSAEREVLDPYLLTNVGREDWNYQVRDLAEAVAKTIGGIQVHINREAQADARSYRVDFERWRGLAPNHQPVETLEGTIRELADHLRQLRDLDAGFRGSPRVRLHQLQQLRDHGYLDENLRWIRRALG